MSAITMRRRNLFITTFTITYLKYLFIEDRNFHIELSLQYHNFKWAISSNKFLFAMEIESYRGEQHLRPTKRNFRLRYREEAGCLYRADRYEKCRVVSFLTARNFNIIGRSFVWRAARRTSTEDALYDKHDTEAPSHAKTAPTISARDDDISAWLNFYMYYNRAFRLRRRRPEPFPAHSSRRR